MAKLLIFAGTTEGRRLIERLLPAKSSRADLEVTACVATEYGREVLEQSAAGGGENRGCLRILSGRLSAEEMAGLMRSGGFDGAVDATHPYAAEVTACIRQACGAAGTPYIRLLREQIHRPAGQTSGEEETFDFCQAVYVNSSQEAAEYLSTRPGPVLLTTGSKELAAFTQVKDYQERLFARVLPMQEVVSRCVKLGFAGRRLICMQGPFSYELNAAMLRQTGARYLVTKETGRAGGFDEKLQAAMDLGVQPVIIGRKPEEEGAGLEEVLEQLGALCGVNFAETETGDREWKAREAEEKSDWFPLFINIYNKNITVVGAGKIAARRIRTLLQFSCRLTVIAPEPLQAVRDAASAGLLKLVEKEYAGAELFDMEDVPAADYVLAATNDRNCNHRIYCDCKARGIPVNVADCRSESDFYFPGVARRGCVVAGVTAGGRDHGLAKRASARVREALAGLEDGGGNGGRGENENHTDRQPGE